MDNRPPAVLIGEAMMSMTESVAPILDAAEGMRAEMQNRGWSPTAAETAALQYLMNGMQVVWTGIGRGCEHGG